MSDVRYPEGNGPGEIGFAAVRAKYGPDMVIRMNNWPRLAEVYCKAQNGDEEMVEAETLKAARNRERAKVDRDFALDQAGRIARSVERDQWNLVPSVAQLRREWGMDEPVGTVHRTDLPPVKRHLKAVGPVIEVDEAEVEAKRKAAARMAEKLKQETE
jgi:hypothetical protein